MKTFTYPALAFTVLGLFVGGLAVVVLWPLAPAQIRDLAPLRIALSVVAGAAAGVTCQLLARRAHLAASPSVLGALVGLSALAVSAAIFVGPLVIDGAYSFAAFMYMWACACCLWLAAGSGSLLGFALKRYLR